MYVSRRTDKHKHTHIHTHTHTDTHTDAHTYKTCIHIPEICGHTKHEIYRLSNSLNIIEKV